MNPVKNNLVALGSAAVVAVYAAGYVRTQSAADRFVTGAHERRPPVPVPSSSLTHDTSTALLPRAESASALPAPVAPKPDRPRPASGATAEKRAAASTARHVAAPVHAADSTAAPRADSARAASTPAIPARAPEPAAARDSSSKGAATRAADSTTQAGDPKATAYKDGVYTGWGASRHGDIQAQVEIKDGRIVDASIRICLTQYSCSWIAALPPQVVARQSPETDFVTGATQSTNAFYYAVVEALGKAK